MGVPDIAVANKFILLRKSAKKRGIEFNLSLTSVRNLLNAKRCYYTGTPLVRGDDSIPANRFSVDRKDASKGYIKGNVVACTEEFNHRKSNLTADDIKILYKKVCK